MRVAEDGCVERCAILVFAASGRVITEYSSIVFGGGTTLLLLCLTAYVDKQMFEEVEIVPLSSVLFPRHRNDSIFYC